MPKSNEYKHIAAWCQMMNSKGYWVLEQQAEAAADDAPIDAIYKRQDGSWATFAGVDNADTRWVMGNILKSYGIETEDGA